MISLYIAFRTATMIFDSFLYNTFAKMGMKEKGFGSRSTYGLPMTMNGAQ